MKKGKNEETNEEGIPGKKDPGAGKESEHEPVHLGKKGSGGGKKGNEGLCTTDSCRGFHGPSAPHEEGHAPVVLKNHEKQSGAMKGGKQGGHMGEYH